jgi:large subunit ribosomal protein L13
MKYSILKSKIITRCFSTSLKINKFADISKKPSITPIKIPDDLVVPEKYGLDTTPPKPGEIYHLPYVNSKLIALEMGYKEAFNRDPVSSYYSMKIKDKLYHVFNAARCPLGRMCTKIAFVIQGKTSPHYRPNKVEYKDVCVIVNASKTWLTGKKLEQKLYRHHTGYPGGLKEIKARHYLEKNPQEMILRSIKGMLPKNKMRNLYLSKVKIYNEGGHDLFKLGLPQFGKIKPLDYNEIFGVNKMLDEGSKIIATNMKESEIPAEFKNLKREIKDEFEEKKTVVNTRMKIKFDNYMRRWRYRQYRNIRNKAYRYL